MADHDKRNAKQQQQPKPTKEFIEELMAQNDERSAKQQQQKQKSSGGGAFFQEMVEQLPVRAQLGYLQNLKNIRDKLDAGVPKYLSLTHNERFLLGGEASIVDLMIDARTALQRSLSKGSFAAEKAEDPASKKLQKTMMVLAFDLQRDLTKLTPKEQKAHAADVVQSWSIARAALNEILETPSARQLLQAKPKKP